MEGVEVDASAVLRGMRKLAGGLDRIAPRESMDQARHTASKVKSGVPVLTGRLAATVKPSKIVGGAAVSYGGTLPYARKIERRSHAVQDGIEGAQAEFIARMTVAAEREVNSL